MIDCKLGPDPRGNYIQMKISMMDHEIMCKQTVDENFCNCNAEDLEEIKIISTLSIENVLEEFYTGETITKEVIVEVEVENDVPNLED